MEIPLLRALLTNISSFMHSLSCENLTSRPVQKYYEKAEEILKLLKPMLDTIIDSEIASDELFKRAFEELGQSVDELRKLFNSWHSLSSKVYFALRVESLISKIRDSELDLFQLLKSTQYHLPDELNSEALEPCIQKVKHAGYAQMSDAIEESMNNQAEGARGSTTSLVKIKEFLNLGSNWELLIEAVALEKLKENAEQADNMGDVEYIDKMISFVTCMHDRFTTMKQTRNRSPVPIPADFCCPLSLELMTDPVIVASGQTYERAFIKNWIDLGLTVCPKTRQTLAHTNLIPNYTVKALIANWCESNNVKLPEAAKSLNLAHFTPLSFRHNPISNESTQFSGLSPKCMISSRGVSLGGTSSSHPCSSSDGSSLTSVAGNGHVLDMGRLSLLNAEERLDSLEGRRVDLAGRSSVSPPRTEIETGGDSKLSHSHNRSDSASSTHSNAKFYGADDRPSSPTAVSGEVTAESPASSTGSTQRRELDLLSRLETRSRSHSIWCRPSERLVPRIVSSSAAESRADLSAIEAQVKKLVADLNGTSLDTQREATTELRLLAKHNMENRIIIAQCGVISLLVGLLRSTDTKVQENSVTALLNLSINDNNKTAIANANAIEPLIYVLENGSSEAKENSAATLFSLSVIEDNKIRIGRSGAIRPLVNLLGSGTPRGKKDAATALFNLSIFHENKARIVQTGAVKYLVELMDPAAGMVDKAVAVLANLATIPEGRTAIGQEGGIPVLVEVVELGSGRGKENAAAALLQLCTNNSRFCSMVLQEGAVPPLVALSQSGTPRAREKAQALLSYFRNQRHGAGRG